MKFLSTTAILCLLMTSCRKETFEPETPACILTKIQLLKESDANKVYRVQAAGETYYYFTGEACCDQFDDLFDEQCTLICHPSGGFTGAGSGNCPAAWTIGPRSLELIWER